MELYSSEKMRALDDYVIKVLGVPGTFLMQNAAEHVAEAAQGRVASGGHVAVFCGTGNNGGDGICAAAILAEKDISVRVFLIGDDKKLTDDSMHMRDMLLKAGGRLERFSDCHDIEEYVQRCDVIIDAMYGIGLRSGLSGDALKAAEIINASRAYVIAVDIPSGVHADSGEIESTAVKADITITFTAAKPGLLTPPGSKCCGKIVVKDIGVSPGIFAKC